MDNFRRCRVCGKIVAERACLIFWQRYDMRMYFAEKGHGRGRRKQYLCFDCYFDEMLRLMKLIAEKKKALEK